MGCNNLSELVFHLNLRTHDLYLSTGYPTAFIAYPLGIGNLFLVYFLAHASGLIHQ